MTTRLVLLLPLLLAPVACAGPDPGDGERQSKLDELRARVPETRRKIEADDALLAKRRSEIRLDAAQLRGIEEFVSRRREALRRLERSLEEFAALDSEIRRLRDATSDEAREKALAQRIASYKLEQAALQKEFETLQNRDREIQSMLDRARKR